MPMKSKRGVKLKPGMLIQVSFKAGGYDSYAAFIPSYTVYGRILSTARGKIRVLSSIIHGLQGDVSIDYEIVRRKITFLRIIEGA